MFRRVFVVLPVTFSLTACATLLNEALDECGDGYELVCDGDYSCYCKEKKDAGEPDPNRRG